MVIAPIYLGSLCTQLDECVLNVMRSLGPYNVVSHVDYVFLQMFLWERFGNFAATYDEYSATVACRVIIVNPTGAKSVHRARALRWVGVKQSADKSLATIIDKEENFNLRPYVYIPHMDL